jgi:ATPase family associated with various cellular activities (AAA)
MPRGPKLQHSPSKRPASERLHVLVVGDWFVDDHWVAGTYRSSTSSRTGKKHLAGLQDVHSATESLCGAGRTACILHRAGFQISGVGICAPNDDNVLMAMLEPRGLRERNPHSLRRWTSPKYPADAVFLNLGTADCGTSRALRIYERVGRSTLLSERFDWETEVPKIDLDRLKDFLDSVKHKIDAIVVKDLAKGLVRPAVIKAIAGRLANLPWFVSSKSWLPPWFNHLPGVDLRLLLIPEIAARSALGTRIDNDQSVSRTLASWFVELNQPSKGALAMLENKILRYFKAYSSGPGSVSTDTPGPAPAVVVVPDDRAILAFSADGKGFIYRHEPAREVIPMPMSSVLLGALTGRMLTSPTASLVDQVKGAAEFTHRWRQAEQRRVTHYRSWKPEDEPKDTLEIPATGETKVLDWHHCHEEWKAAYSHVEHGIIETPSGLRLELWRGMTELHGYICIVRSKRESIAALVHSIRSFVRDDQSGTRSCLLIAPPGAGKTQLVRCLAKIGDFRVLRFNISFLYHQEEILDCFDRIATTQAELGNSRLLVFFDEINGKVEGESVYRSFLTPLEEMNYSRAEKIFHLQPAFWLFSGTSFEEGQPKAADFKSRLTHGVIHLETPNSDNDQRDASLERVYLGASLLKGLFPEIEMISEDVLDLFSQLPHQLSNRGIVDFARSFVNVRHRKVVRENIPWEWIEDNAGVLEREKLEASWDKQREGGREVTIVEEP